MRVLFLITRAHEGGAQEHVLTLIRGLSPDCETILASGEEGYLTERARGLGVAVHIIPHLGVPINPWQDWRATESILDLIRKTRPDVLHTHSFKAGALGRIAARIAGTPSMFTAHGWAFADGVSLARRSIAIPCEWLLARLTHGIITVSEADHRLGQQYGVARQPKMSTVLNGVDPLPPVPERCGLEVPRIVMVGRFESPKDQSLLVRAVRQLERPFELWFVGDGSQRGRVEAETRSLGLQDRVRFFGTCRNVPEILAQAHIFVLTSRYEGLPISILEAMRSGLPVIANDVGGVSEEVDEGVTGFLIPRGDCVSLRDRLAALLDNRELRRSMGVRGRERFEREFSSQVMVATTRSVYERVVLSARAVRNTPEGLAAVFGDKQASVRKLQ